MTLRMYIVLRRGLATGIAATACAHGSLMAHLHWEGLEPDYDAWLSESFRKVTLSASDTEFEELKKHKSYPVLVHEGKVETALVFLPSNKKPMDLPFYSGQ